MNFKTYEAQSRLLAALVASLEGHRFDYKSKWNECLGHCNALPQPYITPCFLPLLPAGHRSGLT